MHVCVWKHVHLFGDEYMHLQHLMKSDLSLYLSHTKTGTSNTDIICAISTNCQRCTGADQRQMGFGFCFFYSTVGFFVKLSVSWWSGKFAQSWRLGQHKSAPSHWWPTVQEPCLKTLYSPVSRCYQGALSMRGRSAGHSVRSAKKEMVRAVRGTGNEGWRKR